MANTDNIMNPAGTAPGLDNSIATSPEQGRAALLGNTLVPVPEGSSSTVQDYDTGELPAQTAQADCSGVEVSEHTTTADFAVTATNQAEQTRSGVVCIIGRPSVGKSTFLNSVCGGTVSIVSALPQTTRSSIRGILTTAEQGQIIFIDTPGYHISEKKMNRRLQLIAQNRLQEAEAVLYLIDATRPFGDEELAICSLLKDKQDRLIVGINKADSPLARMGQTRISLMQVLPGLPQERIFDLSAQKKTGLDPLVAALFSVLPEGGLFYPEDFYTDQPVDFRIAEIIRGQAISRLYEEIPHALYVNIQDMEMKKNGKELFVRAFLCVERESQKAMVIGKGAAVIKAIRLESQKELCKIFPYRIQLDLQVRVDKNWRQKDAVLQSVLLE